jgi:hypothetical protein
LGFWVHLNKAYVCIGVMCEIHLFSCIATWTVIFFLLAFLNNDGAKFLSVLPYIHDDVQNSDVLPSPSVTSIDAAKRSISRGSHGSSNLSHALSLLRQWRRRAWQNLSNSRVPSPPLIFVIQDVGQLTNECQPYTPYNFISRFTSPKEASPHMIDLFYEPFEFWKHSQMVDRLGW